MAQHFGKMVVIGVEGCNLRGLDTRHGQRPYPRH